MAGIPSAGGAGTALRGATRVLLRIAVLVGLVVCGWLLGTATGLAQEAGPDDAGTAPDWAHVALARHHSSPAQPAHSQPPADTPPTGRHTEGLLTPLIRSGSGAVAPAAAVLPLPAPVPDMVVRAVGPIADPLVDTVGRAVAEPVVAQVLGTTAPGPSARPAPATGQAPDDQAAPSRAAPAPAAAGPPPAPALPPPQVQAPALAAVSSPGGTADIAAARPAGSSAAVAERSAPPVPASPPGTTGTSCPPGSTGATTVAQAAHAAVLGDGVATADSALVQRRLKTDAGGLPRCVGQRPSTSPD